MVKRISIAFCGVRGLHVVEDLHALEVSMSF